MNRLSVVVALALSVIVMTACSSQDSRGEASYQAVYETRSSQGDISFDVTPRVTEKGQLVVDLSANTHTGDLADLDLTALVSLLADDKTYRPVEATALEGHHSVASVTFDVDSLPSRFTVTIAATRGMEELRFEWP